MSTRVWCKSFIIFQCIVQFSQYMQIRYITTQTLLNITKLASIIFKLQLKIGKTNIKNIFPHQ